MNEFEDKKPAAPSSLTIIPPDTNSLYKFIEFHAVSCSSQNVGTNLEELSYALHPVENGWECGRFVNFPQEVIFQLHTRSKLEYIILACKPNMSYNGIKLYIGDGLSGSFLDVNYREAGETKEIKELPIKIKVYGIGSFIKIVFPQAPEKTEKNTNGQVGISLFRVWGIPVAYYKGVKFDDQPETHPSKEKIDKILIELGVPIDGPEWAHGDIESSKYTPIDEETRETLLALEKIKDQAFLAEDFEKAGNISKDMKKLVDIGTNILSLKRELAEVISKEDFGRAITIKEKLVRLNKMRDAMDALYETPKYEEMIVLKRPSTASKKLQEELEKEENDRIEKARQRKVADAKMHELEEKRLRDMEEKKRRLAEEEEMQRNQVKKEIEKAKKEELKKSPKPSPSSTKKKVKIVIPDEDEKVVSKKPKAEKEENINAKNAGLTANIGDTELEPYLTPLLNAAGGALKELNVEALKSVLEKGLLDVCGVRLWNAIHSESWRHREAAGTAFLQYLEAPIVFLGLVK